MVAPSQETTNTSARSASEHPRDSYIPTRTVQLPAGLSLAERVRAVSTAVAGDGVVALSLPLLLSFTRGVTLRPGRPVTKATVHWWRDIEVRVTFSKEGSF